MLEHIKANAELAVETMRPVSGIDFGYNLDSVEWLQGYIERMRGDGVYAEDADRRKCISVFGSFLGECLIHCYGGEWICHDGNWGVIFGGDIAFPFAKVAKQVENGMDGDGILGFFETIPLVFKSLRGKLLSNFPV